MISIKKLSSFSDLSVFEKENVPFFQTPFYLQTFARHFCEELNVVLLGIFNSERSEESSQDSVLVGYGAFENVDGIIKFLGMKKVLNGQEVTDYGDIYIKSKIKNQKLKIWFEVVNWFKENGFKKVELEYVSITNYELLITNKIQNTKYDIRYTPQEISSNISLPENWETYVTQLEYKNRRELKRKINRLEKETGEMNIIKCFKSFNVIQKSNFQEFVRLHKLSQKEKENFMTKGMEEFFWDLINIKNNNWHAVLNFLQIQGQNVAVILTFENEKLGESLAYNSGYDPKFNFYSPGILVHALKIKELIGKNFKKYDFLRGEERYKFDLGASKQQLYKVNITI